MAWQRSLDAKSLLADGPVTCAPSTPRSRQTQPCGLSRQDVSNGNQTFFQEHRVKSRICPSRAAKARSRHLSQLQEVGGEVCRIGATSV
eukprot:1254864-Rhodomonas_salina.2